jgi:hypothetical protein
MHVDIDIAEGLPKGRLYFVGRLGDRMSERCLLL